MGMLFSCPNHLLQKDVFSAGRISFFEIRRIENQNILGYSKSFFVVG